MASQRTCCRALIAVAMAVAWWVSHSSWAATSNGIDYPSAWECDATKFNWYCVVEPPAEDQKLDPAAKTKKPLTKEEQALQRLEQWKRELEAKRALSIMEPTPENVKEYIKEQNKLMQTASVYSDVWRRVIWQSPDLNYELKRPVNAAGIEVLKKERKSAEIKTLNDLTREWGIFFFFRSDCPFCHRMSTTLKLMTELYGITVFPVSLDGGGLPEYPQAKPDNGLASALGITQVPTMVLGNVKDRRMIIVGSGVVAIDDLIQRIYVLTQTKPGDLY
ncbi:conjugal transfer protein TraF [Sulfuricystis multivorans]|uniref:conjugal transfer protein TraF n=1 Tax=Sulfuricystis multivorans TaxID=2211108 RepID=UPI000F838A66|nr:conjugal transfer protein TraF [Sulfuricystis multivorans]